MINRNDFLAEPPQKTSPRGARCRGKMDLAPVFEPPGPPDLDDWLAQVTEDPLEPDLPIIDCHHHLWDTPGAGRPGSAPPAAPSEDGLPPLSQVVWGGARGQGSKRYMAEEFLADVKASGHNIVATVYAQCHHFYDVDAPAGFDVVGETRCAQEAADACAATGEPIRLHAGMFADLDLRGLGASAEEVILAHKKYKCFRGIRNNLHGCCIMEEGFVDPSGEVTSAAHAVLVRRPFEDPTFLEGFPLLAKHGLLFECASWHNETPQLTALARRFPEQTIVCDHVSTPLGWGPYSSLGASAAFEEWKANMTELATCPKVTIKLSGLTMPSTGFRFETRETPPGSEEVAERLAPWYLFALEQFGANALKPHLAIFNMKSNINHRLCLDTLGTS
jgi:predicted TIM-barrel fold metal-dependent hydrolase